MADTVQGPLEVFNASLYPDTVGYCAGDDYVSRVLVDHGSWEPHVMAGLVELGVLDDTGDHDTREVVLDIGCHIGWYSRLAASYGYHVLAVDGELEHLDMTAANVARTAEQADRELVLCRGWIDADTKEVDVPEDGTRVRLVKADIESHERHAVRAVRRLLDAGIVDYLLLEISPVFRDDYAAEVLWPLRAAGYELAYRLHGGVREWDWSLDFPQEEILFTRPA
jgi:SAM-dependent methyltransferase